MNQREYVELVCNLFNKPYKEYKNKKGSVDRAFFDSSDLKMNIEQRTELSIELHDYPPLSQGSFDEIYPHALNQFKHRNYRDINKSYMIEDDKNDSWVTNEVQEKFGWFKEDNTTYRTRYLTYLKDKGRTEGEVNSTASSSLKIIKKFGNPKEESFFRKGLVVGNVQSGKTENFNGVLNSAIDMGYRLIIVLSGIMEDLRVQTQRRLHEDVVGFYENGKRLGVAKVKTFGDEEDHPEVKQINVPTSVDSDFDVNMRDARFNLNQQTNVLVCKKNTAVLANLLIFLDKNIAEGGSGKLDIPLLIIDDEADNASLNNYGSKGAKFATEVNARIRAILCMFNKKVYLGYTATPFANVLQDRNEEPEDNFKFTNRKVEYEFPVVGNLFPDDFIELLTPSNQYLGAKNFFATQHSEENKVISLLPKPVNDHLDDFPTRFDKETELPTSSKGKGTRSAQKTDDYPQKLPQSLEDAVMCFIISCAIRASRRKELVYSPFYQPHNTMLIHVSLFTSWQGRTKELLDKYIKNIKARLEIENKHSAKTIYSTFENKWDQYYAYIIENIKSELPSEYIDNYLSVRTFEEIKGLLFKAVSDIEVKAINSETGDKLIYPSKKSGIEKKYIAVGGNRLSRGFTLEGLTINYFLRETNYADTLLQMGRWFGYRPGYIDCCKLFTTAKCLDKFNQTSLIVEDLEQRFIDMNRDPHVKPFDYGLRVLNNPKVIKITRPSMLKNSKDVKWSYSDHLIQTTQFKIENKRLNSAWGDLTQFINKYQDSFEYKRNPKSNKLEYVALNASPAIVFDVLRMKNSFNIDETSEEEYFKSEIDFIKKCNGQKNAQLNKWTVAIKTGGEGHDVLTKAFGLDENLSTNVRSGPSSQATQYRDSFENEHVFVAGGATRNIISKNDMKLRLSITQIDEAETKFINDKLDHWKSENPSWTQELLEQKKASIKRKGFSEKVYRNAMSENEGLLVIYLIDSQKIFTANKAKGKGKENISKLSDLKSTLTEGVPLIGYAIGIPKISKDIGNTFAQFKDIENVDIGGGEDENDIDFLME
ncbi:MAG: Z1 domain-containing protein [Colwellia sp.]|nr:Z1 domain-containing protein [Colwellia sp.]